MSVWAGLLWLVGTLQALVVILSVGGHTTRKWRCQERISAAGLLLNILTFAGAVAGVLIAYNAFTETRRQVDEAARQGDVSDDRTKIDQRGQLVANEWTVNRLESGQTPVASFVLSNPGRTPAYMLGGTYEAVTSVDLPKHFTDYPRRLPGFPGIIMQGQKSSIVIFEHLPPVDANSVRDGTLFFYLRIIVWYRDIFGTRYELRATAKYGKIIDSNGDPGFGFEFPEVPLSEEFWKVTPKEFVEYRQYNSHKRIED